MSAQFGQISRIRLPIMNGRYDLPGQRFAAGGGYTGSYTGGVNMERPGGPPRMQRSSSSSQISSSGNGAARQVGRTISHDTLRAHLVRPEADPRNWFLSSERKHYNPHGKTRVEKEQFKSTPAIPVMQDNCRRILEFFGGMV